MTEIPDETLAGRAASGDLQAFEELVNRHRVSVYRLARSITGSHDDADDAAQETFMRVHGALSSFDVNRSFKAWLRRITYNTSLNILRAACNRRKHFLDSQEDLVSDPAPNPEVVVQNRDAGNSLQTVLESLTADLRATIVLRASEGMSYREIARTTGVKIGTVMSRLSRARERIHAALESLGELEKGGDAR